MSNESVSKCPVMHTAVGSPSNLDWWPNQVNLKVLHQHGATANPMEPGFDYPAAFATIDLDQLTGLVACRLRPLRTADDSSGLAQRRHLSHL
jgi:catalase (peroxidase I)